MELEKFISDNRRKVDDEIRAAYPRYAAVDDDDRWDIICNTESLYNWAIGEGVEGI